MRTVETCTGAVLPVLGLGTWRMGESASESARESAALVAGLDLGVRLIDTAEMYGDGGAEEVVAAAIAGRRDEVFLVSKVLPWNASRDGTPAAAERSLSRLRTDRIDLYLLHWPGSHPLEDTFEAFERLREQGKVLHWGVSNFDPAEMREASALPQAGRIACNQVLYNLERRGVERALIPGCVERGIAVMAYSPLEQGRLDRNGALARVAARHDATPEQIAIAWVLRLDGLVTIPKASSVEHVRLDVAAAGIRLTPEDLAELDRGFPAPDRDVPLEIL